MQALLKDGNLKTIMEEVQKKIEELEQTQSNFWTSKVPPFIEAILSALVPLRNQKLLFNPENEPANELNGELLLRWSDLVSLKLLYFTILNSNLRQTLDKRVNYSEKEAASYAPVELLTLKKYLIQFEIDLKNELNDFPSRHYNLHQGISNVIKTVL